MSYKLDDLYEAIVAEKRKICDLQIKERIHGSGALCFESDSDAPQPKTIYMSPAYHEEIGFEDVIDSEINVTIAVQIDLYENGETTGEYIYDSLPITLTGDLAADLAQYFSTCKAYLENKNV